jgi:polar amino acid transport system substrate-binding protein
VKRSLALAMITLAGSILAGCGSGSDRAQTIALAALGVKAPQPAPPTPPQPSKPCGDVTASLPPPAVMPAPGAMPGGSFMARIERRGYLIAGVDQNTLLFAYFNPLVRQPEGFEIDLLRKLAKAIFGDPSKIQFKAVTTAERIPAVQGGSVDVVADAVTTTCQRRQKVDFSTVYFDAAQRVLVRSDAALASVKDLAGKRVCATMNSTSIQNIERLVPSAIRSPVAQRTDCLVALQQGRVDAVTSDDAILLGFKAQDPYTKIVGPRLEDEPYAMAISKAHPDFVRFVNGVLGRIRSDGVWRSIYSRWLGGFTQFRTPAPPVPHYVK